MPRDLRGLPLGEMISSPAGATIGTVAVDRMLRIIREHLDMDVAFVAEFRATDRVFRHVDARGRTPIHAGDAAPLENGYCQRVVDGELPELIADTRQVDAAMALPETSAIPIGSHLSVPIRLGDGRVYGTLCCFSFVADQSLHRRDLAIVRIFADLLAEQLDQDLGARRTREEKSARINVAMSAGQPTMVYQPVFDLVSRRVVGVEALSRFNVDPPRPPAEWFTDAREAGLSVELELAAIRAALRALPALPADLYLSLNCSPQTLMTIELQEVLSAVDPGRVVLEISEHDQVRSYGALTKALAPLRGAGLRVAIDDAGVGSASLRHVLNIHPELIKLDISVTRNIDTDKTRRPMASGLIAFARESQARLVAEGVETEGELRTLRSLGVGYAQGYAFARPMPLPDALACVFPAFAPT